MTAKITGVISAQDWENGSSSGNDSEKAAKVLVYLGTLAKGEAASMKAIKENAGMKWPYSTVKALVKLGTVAEKKIGKKNYFRVA